MELLFSIVVGYFAARFYGPDVNRWLWGPYTHQGDFSGYALAFFPGLIAGVFLWPFFRSAGHDLVTTPVQRTFLNLSRMARRQPALPADAEQVIEEGTKVRYVGLIDRDLTYFDSRTQKARIQSRFELERNTMAMPPRERAALTIFAKLSHHGLLDPQTKDRIHFALAWGDGRCLIREGKKFTANIQALRQNGIRTFKDMIALDATERDISIDGAITELFNALQAAASRPNAPADVVDMLKSFQP